MIDESYESSYNPNLTLTPVTKKNSSCNKLRTFSPLIIIGTLSLFSIVFKQIVRGLTEMLLCLFPGYRSSAFATRLPTFSHVTIQTGPKGIGNPRFNQMQKLFSKKCFE